MATHILVIDDEALLRRSLTYNLEQAGYRVSAAANAENGLSLARRDRPDLVLLDIGLPGMDGLDALRLFRRDIGSPVIFLTARRQELDQVMGLEMGADDYVTKPFDLNVLLARVKAVLRRSQSSEEAVAERVPVEDLIEVGDLVIDPKSYSVMVRGKRVDLAPREFDLLHALALNIGKVCAVDDLLAQVWGAEYEGEPQVVYVHIRWLREKLEDDPGNPTRILTVRGRGYILTTGQPIAEP